MSAKPEQTPPAAPNPPPQAGPGRVEVPAEPPAVAPADPPTRPREIGGPKGPEPTRYGDWEVGGRCTDF